LIFLVPANLRKSLLEQFKTLKPEEPTEKTLAKYFERIYSVFLHSRFFLYLTHIEMLLNSMVGKVPILFLLCSLCRQPQSRFHGIEFTPFSDYWFVLHICFQSR